MRPWTTTGASKTAGNQGLRFEQPSAQFGSHMLVHRILQPFSFTRADIPS